MAWTKTNTAATAAIVAVCLAAPFILQHRAQAQLQAADDLLRSQRDKLTSQQADNEHLAQLVEDASRSQKQSEDLRRLRAEVATLQPKAAGAAEMSLENKKLQGSLDPQTRLQIKERAVAKLNYGGTWIRAFFRYAGQNQGQFPATFDQAAALLADEAKSDAQFRPDLFDIVFSGTPASLAKPQDVIVLREKDPTPGGKPGTWMKIYFFADGHGTVQTQPSDDFSAFESAHAAPPENSGQ